MTITKIQSEGLSKPVDLADNEKIRLGTGNDLEIFHNGFNSKIADVGTGALILSGSTVKIENGASDENLAVFTENGGVELYYDNVKHFETISAGLNFTGSNADQLQWQKANNLLKFRDGTKAVFGEGDDLQIYGGEGGTGAVVNSANGDLFFRHGSEEQLILRDDGNVELYSDNVKTFATKSGGNTLYGTDASGNVSLGRFYYKQESGTVKALYDPYNSNFQLYDGVKATFGNDHDLKIWHDGAHSYIQNAGTGHLYIKDTGIVKVESDSFKVDNAAADKQIIKTTSDKVELYQNNVKKFETQAGGVSLMSPGDDWNEIHRSANGYYGFSWIKEDGSTAQAYLGVTGAAASINNSAAAQDLVLRTQTNFILTKDYATKLLATDSNGAVELYYGNSKKLETANGGINITNSGAIYLGGTGSANALYDYEKGTFTPRFHGQGNNNTITTSTNIGDYVKIGRLVHVKIRVIFTDRNGANSGLAMDGLPFSNAGNHTCTNLGRWANVQNHSVVGAFSGHIGDGSQEIEFNSLTSTGTSSSDVNQTTDSTTVMLNFCYPVWGQ